MLLYIPKSVSDDSQFPFQEGSKDVQVVIITSAKMIGVAPLDFEPEPGLEMILRFRGRDKAPEVIIHRPGEVSKVEPLVEKNKKLQGV